MPQGGEREQKEPGECLRESEGAGGAEETLDDILQEAHISGSVRYGDAVMESVGVSKMTALLMLFRGDLLSGKTKSGSKGLFILSVLFCISAWRPVTAGALTDLEFERSPNTIISSLGKPVTLQCTLKGTGGEEEDPPDVLWLRDGALLPFADTNQIQVHTGSNSWTIMSTLR
ncbi:hypothetical protein JOQ06_014331 [Pogonophryne albipinna]|uniref:Ig-like domain-containing protein n=1 Tax=Pogonophryne albipinna TaxID=1090488 RepID=A0AAD6F4A3_9TELE|nr:hypothetical protein JOQ06_014331 [Pogonophryne albipinna]